MIHEACLLSSLPQLLQHGNNILVILYVLPYNHRIVINDNSCLDTVDARTSI